MNDGPKIIQCTDPEIRVLTELVRDGAENKIIGKRLFLSEDTIKTHMKRVNRRANMHNRTHLALSLLKGTLVVINTRGKVHDF